MSWTQTAATSTAALTVDSQDSQATEGRAMKLYLDRLLHGLILVRLGQELGSDTEMARAVACSIDFLASSVAHFLR